MTARAFLPFLLCVLLCAPGRAWAQSVTDSVIVGAAGDGGEDRLRPFLRRRIPPGDLLWQRALNLHYDAVVLDGHIDTPERMLDAAFDFTVRHPAHASHIDLPRMREGGLDGGFFSIYVPTGYGEGTASFQRALRMIRELKRQAARVPDQAEIVTDSAQLVRVVREGRRAVLLGLEGAHALGGELDRIERFFEEGIRYISITHNRPNKWGDTAQAPARWNGLSEDGILLVQALNDRGILVDLSHASDSTFYDVLATSRAPVLLSHSSARALTDHVRNATDDMLRALAANRGVILINFYETLIRPASRRGEFTDVVDHILHVASIAGVDHVGLGSDFDGARMPIGLEDVTRLPWITHRLLQEGLAEKDIRKILGGNLLRVLAAAESAADATPSGDPE